MATKECLFPGSLPLEPPAFTKPGKTSVEGETHLVPNKSYPWEGQSVCRILLYHCRLERKKTRTSKSYYFIYNFVSYQFKTLFCACVHSQQSSCKGKLKSIPHCVPQIPPALPVCPKPLEEKYQEQRRDKTLESANTSGGFHVFLPVAFMKASGHRAMSLLPSSLVTRLEQGAWSAGMHTSLLRPTSFRLGFKHGQIFNTNCSFLFA